MFLFLFSLSVVLCPCNLKPTITDKRDVFDQNCGPANISEVNNQTFITWDFAVRLFVLNAFFITVTHCLHLLSSELCKTCSTLQTFVQVKADRSQLWERGSYRECSLEPFCWCHSCTRAGWLKCARHKQRKDIREHPCVCTVKTQAHSTVAPHFVWDRHKWSQKRGVYSGIEFKNQF